MSAELLTGIAQLDAFRSLVRDEIAKALKRDGYHKRFEGAITYTVTMPPVVDWSAMPDPLNRQSATATEHVLELYCYVIGPARQYKWAGATADEVFSKATADFKQWALESAAEDEVCS